MVVETPIRASGFDLTARRTSRARRVSLSVHCDGRVVVTLPWAADSSLLGRTVSRHAGWIRRRLAALSRLRDQVFLPRSRRTYLARREEAREFVRRLIAAQTAIAYGLRRVAIRDTRRNWGSCSMSGNLNFNWKLLLLPPSLAEYVVVHELCHLREHNHSPRFWALVAARLPDWRERRRDLRRYHL